MSITSLRTSVALTESSHIAVASVTGPGRFELVDRVSSCELLIHDSEILPSLFLDSEGRVQADIEICRASDSLLILAEGMSPERLVQFLEDHRPPGGDADLRDLSATHAILALNGPYAWELLSELIGPGVMGQPHLTFFADDEWTCFRTSKTGENGYHLLVPIDGSSEMKSRILDRGRRFDITCVGVDELDRCQLENGVLCMRAAGITGYNPIELQQQWRVSYSKAYVGSNALLACRRGETTRRSAHLASAVEISAGDRVRFEQEAVGTILQTAYSAVRQQWVASAVVDRRFAYPGLSVLRVERLGAGAHGAEPAVTTITAPMINNRSLYVNPRLHSYFTRDEVNHPPLDMDASWVDAGVADGP